MSRKAAETVLVLRSCRADGSSHNGWKYPLTEGATVEAPDWNDRPECGGGFHGLLWGEGNLELLCWDHDAWWQIFEVGAGDVVKIDDEKVKFRRGRQVFLRQSTAPGYALARAYIIANRPKPASLAPASTAGDRAPASTAGYLAPASTAGDRAPASTAGDRAPASTAGDRAPASTAGRAAIAACLGFASQAKAGPDGCIIIAWWEGEYPAGRPRVTVGYVGENGIEQDTWYRANEKGELFPVDLVREAAVAS